MASACGSIARTPLAERDCALRGLHRLSRLPEPASTTRQHRGVEVLAVVGRPVLVGEVECIASAVESGRRSIDGTFVATPALSQRAASTRRLAVSTRALIETQRRLRRPGCTQRSSLPRKSGSKTRRGSRSFDGASCRRVWAQIRPDGIQCLVPSGSHPRTGRQEAEEAEDLPSQRSRKLVITNAQSSTSPRSRNEDRRRQSRVIASAWVGATSAMTAAVRRAAASSADPMSHEERRGCGRIGRATADEARSTTDRAAGLPRRALVSRVVGPSWARLAADLLRQQRPGACGLLLRGLPMRHRCDRSRKPHEQGRE